MQGYWAELCLRPEIYARAVTESPLDHARRVTGAHSLSLVPAHSPWGPVPTTPFCSSAVAASLVVSRKTSIVPQSPFVVPAPLYQPHLIALPPPFAASALWLPLLDLPTCLRPYADILPSVLRTFLRLLIAGSADSTSSKRGLCGDRPPLRWRRGFVSSKMAGRYERVEGHLRFSRLDPQLLTLFLRSTPTTRTNPKPSLPPRQDNPYPTRLRHPSTPAHHHKSGGIE